MTTTSLALAKINVDSKPLLSTLKHLKSTVKRNHPPHCEVTVTDGKLTLAVPGAIFELFCTTEGTCKFSIHLLYFIQVIKDFISDEILMIVEDGKMQINGLRLSVKTSFFEDDRILRTIDLPINYTDGDLLRLSRSGYTDEEIEFNKLKKRIKLAEENYDKKLMAAYKILMGYGVEREELGEFVKGKLYERG